MTNIVKFGKLVSYVTGLCGYKLQDNDITSLLDAVEACYPAPEPLGHRHSADLVGIIRVFEELKAGRKIGAIKELRNMTGAGLMEAKNAIEIIYENKDA